MKKGTIVALALCLLSATSICGAQEPIEGRNLGSVTGGDFKVALGIIEKKCTACHSSSLINRAIASHKNMAEIQKSMEKKGAKLTSNEREVLGIYWKQQPLKAQKR